MIDIDKDKYTDLPPTLDDFYSGSEYEDHEYTVEYYNQEDKKPEDALTYVIRGRAKWHTGDYNGTFDDCTKAIELDSNEIDAYLYRAYALKKMGDNEGAFEDFAKAVELDRRNTIEYNDPKNKKINVKDFEVAVEGMNKEIEKEPEEVFYYSNRGYLNSMLGNYEKAIADCTKAIELEPEDDNSYFDRGKAKFQLNDYEGAIVDFTKAIEMYPDNSEAYHRRGIAKRFLEDYDGFIEDCVKALDLRLPPDLHGRKSIVFYKSPYEAIGERIERLKMQLETHNNIVSKVNTIIVKILGVEEAVLSNETRFMIDLGADELDFVDLMMGFEEEFNIFFPKALDTVGEVVDFIEKHFIENDKNRPKTM